MLESPSRAVLLAAFLLLTGALSNSSGAGEPAQVSTPSNRKGPAELPNRRRQPSFRPLDGSSMGGVMDGKAADSIPQVDPVLPDARKQLELLERLDRKRNFLLSDPTDSTGKGQMRSFDKKEDGAEETLSVGPRKPRTALERRLKGDAEAARTTAGNASTDNPRMEKDRRYADKDRTDATSDRDPLSENDEEAGDNSRDNRESGEAGDLTQSFQKQLDPGKDDALERRLSRTGVSPGISSMGAELDSRPDNLRSTSPNGGGRGSLVDDLSRQRLERYQQVTGGGGLMRSEENHASPAFSGRGREMRVDAFGTAGVSPAASKPGGGLARPETEGPNLDLRANRPGLASPSSTFSLPTPSAGSSLLGPPPSTPSARMLQENRPTPPRFQP